MAEPHEGWLHKAAGKRWKKRWFVLEDGRLSLFSSEAKKMSLGSLAVSGATVELSAHDEMWVFQLVPAAGKTTTYGAESSDDRRGWVEALGAQGVAAGETATDPSKRPAGPGDAASPDGGEAGSGAGAGAATPSSAPPAAAHPPAASPAPAAAPAPAPSDLDPLLAKYRDPSAENLAQLFDMVDSSGDGVISVCEWCAAIRKLKIPGGSKLRHDLNQQLKLFNFIDTDGSGDVDRDEFVEGLTGTDNEALSEWMSFCLATAEQAKVAAEAAPVATAPPTVDPSALGMSEEELEMKRQQLEYLYSIIDVNGDGDVTVSELLGSFRKYAGAEPLSTSLDKQLRLFASMDADGSGGLDKEEFVAASLQIKDDAFTEWVDRVLYEDRLSSHNSTLDKVDASAEAAAATVKKKDRASVVVASANPFFSAAGSPRAGTPTSGPASPASGAGTPRSAAAAAAAEEKEARARRTTLVLGRVAKRNPLAGGRRKRGAKK